MLNKNFWIIVIVVIVATTVVGYEYATTWGIASTKKYGGIMGLLAGAAVSLVFYFYMKTDEDADAVHESQE